MPFCITWRTLAETYHPPRLLLGEAYSLDVEQWAGYIGGGDELDLAKPSYVGSEPSEACV